MHIKSDTLLQGGKYKIVRHISSGGFGNTYEALDVNLDKRVAVKEFFVKDFCSRESDTTLMTIASTAKKPLIEHLKKKFIEEARAIAKMEHDNIVKVQALFEENGTAYYVMDYIDGESLSALLKRRGSLPEKEALPIILKVADALGYIHKQNRFHLDVKPANIMLRKDGKVILIDFGSSKQYAEVDGENTTTLAPCYTPGYAPSEQMNPKPTAFTAATDVYALGATLYKMLTGQTPPSAIDLLNDDETLSSLPQEISHNVKKCVEKAMIPQRNKRMQSVEEFVKMLTMPVENEDTIIDHHEPTKDKEGPKKSSNVMAIAIACIVMVVIIGGIVGYNIYQTENVRTTSPAPGEPPVMPEVYTYTANGVSFEMVEVEGGTFNMGATSEQESDAYDNEKPVHQVTLSNYYIGKYEVTQDLWQAVMGSNPSHFKGNRRPVECVSWDDCQTFISKLNTLTGKSFRLTTEAEWEFAARGGNNSKHYKYSGSDNLSDVAWYDESSGDTTHDVGMRNPNELGIFDMSGNVWEWCSDWYDSSYNSNAQTNPTGPSGGSDRVYRGGSWLNDARGCRSSFRGYNSPGFSYYTLGLRLVLVP